MKKRFLSVLLLCALMMTMGIGAVTASAEDQPEYLPDIDIHSWEYRLCNAYNSVAFYICEYGPIEGQGLDPRVVPHAQELLRDARAQGYTIYMAQAFRNLEWLENNYNSVFRDCEYDPVVTAQAFQGIGVNEHQTGLAIDFTDQMKNRSNYYRFTDPEIFDSELYTWLLENCADYGFVPRYPEGKEYFYGVACPHAHFRYVGEEAAHYMMEHDLCLEEFIMLYDPSIVFIPEHGRFA